MMPCFFMLWNNSSACKMPFLQGMINCVFSFPFLGFFWKNRPKLSSWKQKITWSMPSYPCHITKQKEYILNKEIRPRITYTELACLSMEVFPMFFVSQVAFAVLEYPKQQLLMVCSLFVFRKMLEG